MNRFVKLFAVIGFLVIAAHRLPAPIQEIQENPTAAAKQSAKPKPKRTRKPERIAKDVSPNPQSSFPTPKFQPTPNRRFAGAWSGVLHTNLVAIPETIVVDSTETTMTVIANSDGRRKTGPIERDGDALKVTLGLWGTYSLTPSSDGSTAVLRYENILDSRTELFHRTTTVPVSKQTNH